MYMRTSWTYVVQQELRGYNCYFAQAELFSTISPSGCLPFLLALRALLVLEAALVSGFGKTFKSWHNANIRSIF